MQYGHSAETAKNAAIAYSRKKTCLVNQVINHMASLKTNLSLGHNDSKIRQTVFTSTCLGYCYCVSLYFFYFLPYVSCLVAVCQRELKS